MPAAKSIADLIAALKTERDAIVDQLANDALTGIEPNHSFDGQSVDFITWRNQLHQRFSEIQVQLAALEPFEIIHIQI
jgi:hypothetical protein